MTVHEPVRQFHAGPVICTLWECETRVDGEQRFFLRASIERRHKHESERGKWQASGSLLSKSDIPLAIHCLMKALEEILHKEKQMEEKDNTFY